MGTARLGELGASEERLRVATEAAGVGIWDYAPRTGDLAWDAHCRELFGVSPDAPVDFATFQRGIHPGDRDAVMREVERAMLPEGTGKLRIEHRIVRIADGAVRWIASRGQAFFEGGSAARFIGTTLDITEQQRGRRALELLAATGAALTDRIDHRARVEATARLMIGELCDFCMVELMEGADRLRLAAVAHVDPACEALIREIRRRWPVDLDRNPALSVIRSGKAEIRDVGPERLEAVARDAEHLRMIREVFLGSVVIAPLVTRGITLGALKLGRALPRPPFDAFDRQVVEELARLTATALDNAHLHREAEVARQWLTRLQTVTTRLAEARTTAEVLDVTFTETYAALEASCGALYRVSERRDALDLVRVAGHAPRIVERVPHVPLALALPITDAVKKAAPVFCESLEAVAARYPLAAQSVGPEMRARVAIPILASGRAVAVAVFGFAGARAFSADDEGLLVAIARQAATALERARLYEGEARAREAAEAANRVKDEFLAVVSHDLRTPLTAIAGWTQLLAMGKVAPDRQACVLETIGRNARRQAQLIDDLLDFARIASGKLRLEIKSIELSEVALLALETARPAAEQKGVCLSADIAPGLGSIRGDAGRLQQIVGNLLGNAVKFTPPGAQVTLELRREGDQIALTVSDTGVGIAPEFLPFVFERFRQAETGPARTHGGLGLGLAIVQHLCELHGGRIEAHSEGPGRGATFIARFPAEGRAALEPADAAPAREGERGDGFAELSGLRVLVVDDDADTRDLVASILAPFGAVVTVASSAAEALEAVSRAPPDVLVSDIGMPSATGYDLLREIHARLPGQADRVLAVALTGYARAEDRAEAEQAGFAVHLPKPVDPAALLLTIASLRRRAPPP